MNINQSIAIVGIWIGVGISSFAGEAVVFVAIVAMLATALVVSCTQN